jgi:hypothetical protein
MSRYVGGSDYVNAISSTSLTLLNTKQQSATGQQITLNEATSLVTGNNLTSFLDSVPTSAYCTGCGEALFMKSKNIASTASSSAADTGASVAASKCGGTRSLSPWVFFSHL